MNARLDILFIAPSFKPKMKEESIGTLILAKKAIINGYNAEIFRYWDVEISPRVDYLAFRDRFLKQVVGKSPDNSVTSTCFFIPCSIPVLDSSSKES